MSKGKGRKAAQAEDPLIRCDGCGRWAYISESDFTTSQQAEEADFVCRLCMIIEKVDMEHKKRSEELAKSMNERMKLLEHSIIEGGGDASDTISTLQSRVTELEHQLEQRELDASQTIANLQSRLAGFEHRLKQHRNATLDSQVHKEALSATLLKDAQYNENDKEKEKERNQTDNAEHRPAVSQSGLTQDGTCHSGDVTHPQPEGASRHEDSEKEGATKAGTALSSQAGDGHHTQRERKSPKPRTRG